MGNAYKDLKDTYILEGLGSLLLGKREWKRERRAGRRWGGVSGAYKGLKDRYILVGLGAGDQEMGRCEGLECEGSRV